MNTLVEKLVRVLWTQLCDQEVSSRNKGNSKNPTALLPEIQDKDGESLSNFK